MSIVNTLPLESNRQIKINLGNCETGSVYEPNEWETWDYRIYGIEKNGKTWWIMI